MDPTLMGVSAIREKLELHTCTETAFQFLIDDYGFRLVKSEPTYIRYESDQVFVNIYHGRMSYELGFECGLKNKGEESRYRLPTILRGLIGDDASDIQVLFQSSDRDVISRCLKKLAELVYKHCGPLLRGEESAFVKVERASEDESIEITEKYTVEPIKEQADKAWREKNYEKVKALYESVKDKLTTVEVKRLKYANKHLNE